MASAVAVATARLQAARRANPTRAASPMTTKKAWSEVNNAPTVKSGRPRRTKIETKSNRPGQGLGDVSSGNRPWMSSAAGPTSHGTARRQMPMRRADVDDDVIPAGGHTSMRLRATVTTRPTQHATLTRDGRSVDRPRCYTGRPCRLKEIHSRPPHGGWTLSSAGDSAWCYPSYEGVSSIWPAGTTISYTLMDQGSALTYFPGKASTFGSGMPRDFRFATVRSTP
jgi:hypothetical protein